MVCGGRREIFFEYGGAHAVGRGVKADQEVDLLPGARWRMTSIMKSWVRLTRSGSPTTPAANVVTLRR